MKGKCAYNRSPDGKFTRKIRHYPLENRQEITVTKKNPMELYFQTQDEVQLNEELSLLRTIVVAPEFLDRNPAFNTYRVLVWGILEKDDLDNGWHKVYRLTGTLKALEKVPYKKVSSQGPPEDGRAEVDLQGNYGEHNVGWHNYGFANTGMHNYGVYNKGTRCMGIFNTDPCKFYMFNRPVASEIPWWEWLNRLPAFLVQRSDSFTKPAKWKTPLESFKEASKKADWKEQSNKLLDLPNFDYDIFESITGISKKMLAEADKAWKAKFKKKGK